MPRKRWAEPVLLAIALIAVAALGAMRGARSPHQAGVPSTYDTSVSGYAALYDLLRREGGRPERFELPVAQLSRDARTLVVAGDDAFAGAVAAPGARAFLDGWVRRGGTLVVLDPAVSPQDRRAFDMPPSRKIPQQTRAFAGCAFAPALRGAPASAIFTAGYTPACRPDRATIVQARGAASAVAYRHGRGLVLLFTTPTLFDNLHIAQQQNARLAYALLGGRVLFDERVHGYAAGRTFWEVLPQPMRIAVAVAIAAVLIAIAGANLPFAPPYELRREDDRDSGAYVASLARMLQRGGAAREAIARISSRCEAVLAGRPGDERARMLLREVRTLESTPRPGAHEVLTAGRIFARVRKDYGC